MLHISSVRPNQDQLDDLLLRVLPEQGHWSDEDYLWLTDHTSQLIEVTDGFLEVLPVPTDHHQTLLAYLFDELRRWGGKVLFAPIRVRIRERKFREPDLVLLRDPKDARRSNRYWTGADLAVEVVSPDKPERDLIEKREDYAEGGIPEYWIVDPQSESVLVLVLEGSAYREHCRARRGDQVSSVTLKGLNLDVSALFDAD